MKRFVSVLSILVAAACTDPPTSITLPLHDVDAQMGIVANGGKHAAVPLSGAEEVPARDTHARGTAVFRVEDRGTSMSYRLIAANIVNVVQAHIHIGPAGENGPVAVFLFGPVAEGGGRSDGVLAEGSITPEDFIGPLEGLEMEALIEAMVGGNAYVNVHTNDGIDPPNTGPGDFPGGEIRGQIR